MVQRLTKPLEQWLFGIPKYKLFLTFKSKFSTIFYKFRKLVLRYKWRACNFMEITLDNYIKLKEQKLKRAEIAAEFNIPDWKLKKVIAKNGWGSSRPTISNECAFTDYSEDSCYWAGFLAADGCVTNGILKVCLNYDDTSHLEKLRAFLGSTHSITSNTDKYYRSELGFKHSQIVEDLESNYNIVPRKSLIYKLPKLPEKYFKHFLRGYFDGDGCICESFSNKNSTTATLYTTIVGSGEFIEGLYNTINNLLNINGTISTKDNNVKTIKYCTNASFILLGYMYKDATTYLDRKYSLYTILSGGIRKVR